LPTADSEARTLEALSRESRPRREAMPYSGVLKRLQSLGDRRTHQWSIDPILYEMETRRSAQMVTAEFKQDNRHRRPAQMVKAWE